MNNKAERFYNFIKSERTQAVIAFILYTLFIIIYIVPISLQNILMYIIGIIVLIFFPIYIIIWSDEEFNEESEKTLGKNIISKIKMLVQELILFFIFLLISTFIISHIIIGKPANQISVDNFGATSLYNIVIIIFIGPIFEEFIYRLLPYKFIKNKKLYIIISALLFAGIHVINDPNPLYYIWRYLPNSLYFGYRYHKTQDLSVPISMHILNNLISMLPVILLYF